MPGGEMKKPNLNADQNAQEVELPLHTFLYTIDQIAYMMNVSESNLRNNTIWYVGREYGHFNVMRLKAINIKAHGQKPEWRVEEQEFIRFLKARRIQFRMTRVMTR
jgi:hypothetical protein